MSIFMMGNVVILYIHVPRTGGTSIEEWFKKNGYAVDWVKGKQKAKHRLYAQHFHADLIEKFIRPDRPWQFSFMTVRHPVHRIISEWFTY